MNGLFEIIKLKRHKPVTAIRWALMFFLLRALNSSIVRVEAVVLFGLLETALWRWEMKKDREIKRNEAKFFGKLKPRTRDDESK